MRDPKRVLFGTILLAAGIACGYKANLASQVRDQFDAQNKPSTTLPDPDKDRESLATHMELNHSANIWWVVASVVTGGGLLVTLSGLLGKRTPAKSPA